jgi:hypothetical protein
MPKVLVTQDVEAGESLECRNSRPEWAIYGEPH